jgi:uncharacterized SAM-binding protein YcdF (DUF218 family)
MINSPAPYLLVLTGIGLIFLRSHLLRAIAFFVMAAVLAALTSAWVPATIGRHLAGHGDTYAGPPDCRQSYPVMVILGGGLKSNGTASRATASRVLRAAEFLNDTEKWRVVVSGGPTNEISTNTEADAMAALLDSRLTRKPADFKILREPEARNTRDNAVLTKALLEREGLPGTVVLVTNEIHLMRAGAAFAKEGFQVCGLAAESPRLFALDPLSFDNWSYITLGLHEYVGYLYYWLRGWV